MRFRAGSLMPPDVSHYFDGRDPALREIYERLLAAVARFGPVTVDPKKGSIHLDRKSAFAEVVVRKESLILAFKAAGDIESPRIIKRMKASARRWYLYCRVENLKQLDRELMRWLRQSHELSS